MNIPYQFIAEKILALEHLPKVKLTKLKEADNPKHPNNIQEGHTIVGFFAGGPIVGYNFIIKCVNGNIWKDWYTSMVQEIIDENTFRTLNSIYRWEIINKE